MKLLENLLVLSVACCSPSPPAKGLRGAVLCALRCVLEWFVYVDGTQGNRKKAFSATCHQLLCPCLQLYSSLHGRETDREMDGETDRGDVIGGLTAVFKSLFRR